MLALPVISIEMTPPFGATLAYSPLSRNQRRDFAAVAPISAIALRADANRLDCNRLYPLHSCYSRFSNGSIVLNQRQQEFVNRIKNCIEYHETV